MFIVFTEILTDCMLSQFRVVLRHQVALGPWFLSPALSVSPSTCYSCCYTDSPNHPLTYKDGGTTTPLNVPHTTPWALSEEADRYLRTETPKRQAYKLTKAKECSIFQKHTPSELNLPKSKKT